MSLNSRVFVFSMVFVAQGALDEKKPVISFGPFNPDKVKVAEREAGGPWVRPEKFNPKFVDAKLLRPDARHCFRCHAVVPSENEIQVGMIQKQGQPVKMITPRDAWVQQVVTTRESSVWSKKKAVDLPLALPAGTIQWIKTKNGSNISPSDIRDHIDPKLISVARRNPGEELEIFYTTSGACPNIREQMKSLDDQIFKKGSW